MEENQIHIPKGWVNVKFKDYIYFQEGPGLTSSLFKEVGFPFLNIRCIENSRINKESCQFISPEIANGIYSHFQLEENDLVVSTSGTLGKKAFITKNDLPLLLNTSIIRFKPKDQQKISLAFLNQLLEDYDFLYDLYSQSTGSAQVNVGPTHLKKLNIKIPASVEEQNLIATILSKVDEAIAQTEQLIAKYTRIKTGLMQDLLTKGIDKNGNIRSEETHEFKDSPLGRIPREWEVKKLDDCKTKGTSITYGIVQTFEHIEDGIPVLRTIDLGANGINPVNKLLRTKPSISAKYKRTLLLENDIVCNVRASVGDFNLVSSEYVNCNTTRGVARICPSADINPSYMVWFLKSYKNDKQMELLIKGTTFIDINIGDLRKIWVLLPSTVEQNEIVNKLDKIQNSFKIYDSQLSKLQSLKTGLMQDLLSGKVRANHLIKEIVSV